MCSAPRCPARRPSPAAPPPITSSCRRVFLTFSHVPPRRPGSYGESSRLQTIPSRFCSALAASSRSPPPRPLRGTRHAGPAPVPRPAPRRPGGPEGLKPLAALGIRQPHEVLAVEPEQVEDAVDDRDLLRACLHAAGQVHPALEPLERRAPLRVERDHLAVEDRLALAERIHEPLHLG